MEKEITYIKKHLLKPVLFSIIFLLIMSVFVTIYCFSRDTQYFKEKIYYNDWRASLLLTFNPNLVHYRYRDGETPLHLVESKKTAELLISRGANVNARDKRGYAPLHYGKSIEIVKLLVANGADINAKSDDGMTPLHTLRDYESVEFLISRGADVNAANKEGITPLQLANRQPAILMYKNGARIYDIDSAIKVCDIPKMQDFLKKNLTIRKNHRKINEMFLREGYYYPSESSKIPLCGECYYTSTSPEISKEIMELLLSEGADIDAKSGSNKTLLHLAAEKGSVGLTEFLISKGANLNIKDNWGWTPLQWALNRNNKVIADLLRKNGAKE